MPCARAPPRSHVCRGCRVNQLTKDVFWFRKPALLLHPIKYILFLCSFLFGSAVRMGCARHASWDSLGCLGGVSGEPQSIGLLPLRGPARVRANGTRPAPSPQIFFAWSFGAQSCPFTSQTNAFYFAWRAPW